MRARYSGGNCEPTSPRDTERNLFGTKSERLRVLDNDQQLSVGEVLGRSDQEEPATERQIAG
jgi:hypothetical protein